MTISLIQLPRSLAKVVPQRWWLLEKEVPCGNGNYRVEDTITPPFIDRANSSPYPQS